MDPIRIGCQTYPWKLRPERYAGDLAHMASVTARAGFEGLEAEIVMLGSYFDDPGRAREILDRNGLSLAALVLHQDWRGTEETAEETALSDRALRFLRFFPGAMLMVSHHAAAGDRSPDGAALSDRRERVLSCMASVARRAAEQGVAAAFHPNSSPHSLFRTREDYDVMFGMLSRTCLGWAPDVGHMVNGGMDPLETLRAGRDLIRHVHFKDYAGPGRWALMGEGTVDWPAVVRFLSDAGYGGWIVVEDESPAGETDPDGAVLFNGAYMRRFRRGKEDAK